MSLSSALMEELEVLQSIYMEDLVICKLDEKQVHLQIAIHPSTADDEEKKFVCITLLFHMSAKYPDEEPRVNVKNPRGLSDAHVESIEDNLKSLACTNIGESMLFELIEYAKESLSDNNHPSCACPICLEYIKESDKFFRTQCYHYFHVVCIKGYISTVDSVTCPVCRLAFEIDDGVLSCVSDHIDSDTMVQFVPDEKFLKWREHCQQLYEKQKRKGGIIDIEFEKNKYLISLGDESRHSILKATESTEILNPPDELGLNEIQMKQSHPKLDCKSHSEVLKREFSSHKKAQETENGVANRVNSPKAMTRRKTTNKTEKIQPSHAPDSKGKRRMKISYMNAAQKYEYDQTSNSRVRSSKQKMYGNVASVATNPSHKNKSNTEIQYSQQLQTDTEACNVKPPPGLVMGKNADVIARGATSSPHKNKPNTLIHCSRQLKTAHTELCNVKPPLGFFLEENTEKVDSTSDKKSKVLKPAPGLSIPPQYCDKSFDT